MHDGNLSGFIWNDIFKVKESLSNNYSILYILGSTFIIFIVGAIIDLVRQFIEKYTVNKILDATNIEKKQYFY